MNVAVLSLTRDRLLYTQACFASLHEFAGCRFDHHVWDNGSTDGTPEWLNKEFAAGRIASLTLSPDNQGIYGPLNMMLDKFEDSYDVIVNFDNDCELTVPGTLRAVIRFAYEHPGDVVGPVVQGLRHPPRIEYEAMLDGYRVGGASAVGGILMPIPYRWRYPEGDRYIHADGLVCAKAKADGHLVGQLLDFPVNHYESTDGQHARFPEYFERRRQEGIPD